MRLAAKSALKYGPVKLTGRQALAVGQGFIAAIAESGYSVHACAILPEHAHLVVRRHSRGVTQIVGHLKARATQRLIAEELWPDAERPVWGRKCWRVFLNDEEDVRRAIAYVERNPLKEGKPAQKWSFVVSF